MEEENTARRKKKQVAEEEPLAPPASSGSLEEQVRGLRARLDKMEQLLALPRKLQRPDGVCPICWDKEGKTSFGSVEQRYEFTKKVSYIYKCPANPSHPNWAEDVDK